MSGEIQRTNNNNKEKITRKKRKMDKSEYRTISGNGVKEVMIRMHI